MRGHAQRGCAQQHPVFQRAVDRRFQCAVRGDVAQVDRWATDTQADMALPRAGAVYGAALVAQPGGPDRYGLAGRVQPGVRGQQGVRDGALRLPRVDDDGHAIGQRDARALDAPAVAVGVVERTAQGQGAAQGDIDGGCGGSRLRRGRRGDDAGMRQRGVARRQADAIARGVQVGGDRCIAPCRQRNAGGLHRAVHGQRVAGLQPHAATRRVQRAVRRDPARGGAPRYRRRTRLRCRSARRRRHESWRNRPCRPRRRAPPAPAPKRRPPRRWRYGRPPKPGRGGARPGRRRWKPA